MNEIQNRISRIGVVPVIKLTNPARDAAPLSDTLCAGGVPVAEITFRAEGADEAMNIMVQRHPEMLVGAGTVLTADQVDRTIAAGGQFVVTPGLDVELVRYCQKKGITCFPGCTTPTDYHAAYRLGLEVLKFFPAEQSGGLAKIKAMAAPFGMFKVMPTGGISLKNLAEYAACPIIAACGGSYMCPDRLITEGRWDEITELCKKSVEIVKEARG
ncbi:MAG: bifunctional 4-hydroxy-2-oxoglutarate aldolase/2-dehydro-3-deoxy-phosphogluconate aldolase [Eubacteriales bacterium]|nr:bifunctional 4-hydroxy-2-oxoglutarate aldolase/2-dehydro-3-deoxy-phosphogluconate aldolase [Eubacteriales bacterium]